MAKRWILIIGCSLLAAALAHAQAAAPTVTLDVTDKPVVEVAVEITKQAGVQVGVLDPADMKVTLSLQKVSVEEAVDAFARALEGSWARFYLLEKQPPATPYDPAALLNGLQSQYEGWLDSLGDDKRKEMMGKQMAARQPATPGQPVAPGAGTYATKPAADAPGADEPALKGIMYDPVRFITIPGRTETISLELNDVPLADALRQLTTACCFLIAPSYELTGNVTLKVDKAPLKQTLDEVATQVEGQCRVLYLVDRPHPLSDADADKMFERFFNGRWSKFWALPKEERAQRVQDAVKMIGQWKDEAAKPGKNGQPNMAAQALQRFGPQILSKVSEYTAAMNRDQRDEVKPALQALARAINGQ